MHEIYHLNALNRIGWMLIVIQKPVK